MENPNQPDLFKDKNAENNLIATVKQAGEALAQIATMQDTFAKLPVGQTKVVASVSMLDLLTNEVIYEVDNRNKPAFSTGTESAPMPPDTDEQMAIVSTEFIMALVLADAFRDLANKKLTIAVELTDGLTNPSYITTITTGATPLTVTPKVEMTGPNGPLTEEQVQQAEDAFANMFKGM